ncbi:hypothetical protein D1007_23100 [Hordeum vulgare]|nr:hypothetical protein D1007_23100 [Hordeum vulgare]
MQASRPRGLLLRADGCCNGPVWAAIHLNPGSSMFLARGWKSSAHSLVIGPEHLLHFRFEGSTTLFVRFFKVGVVCLECSVGSSGGSNVDTSGNIYDDISIFSLKEEGDDSE